MNPASLTEQFHDLLRQGFGVEDIALKLDCSIGRVRREVEILRNEGRLRDVLRLKGAI